jgi:hypothetical protein
LDKEGFGVVDFLVFPLFSYTFWLCSPDLVVENLRESKLWGIPPPPSGLRTGHEGLRPF